MLAKLPERKTNQWYSGELMAVLIKANDPVIPVKQEKFSLSDPKSVRYLEWDAFPDRTFEAALTPRNVHIKSPHHS